MNSKLRSLDFMRTTLSAAVTDQISLVRQLGEYAGLESILAIPIGWYVEHDSRDIVSVWPSIHDWIRQEQRHRIEPCAPVFPRDLWIRVETNYALRRAAAIYHEVPVPSRGPMFWTADGPLTAAQVRAHIIASVTRTDHQL